MPVTKPGADINISRISVSGGVGTLVLIVILLAAMSAELPGLRGVAVMALSGGIVFAVILSAWRRHGH